MMQEDPMSMSLACRLEDVFTQHRAQLKHAAHRILGDAHGAEDLVHDAYLKALEAAVHAQAVVKQPLSYACRVVRNLAIDQYRRGAFESQLFEPEDSGANVAAPAACTPEAVAAGRQELTLVEGALAELPERSQRVFELYRLEGLTQREIGVLLGISATTVNSLIRDVLDRCRAALRKG